MVLQRGGATGRQHSCQYTPFSYSFPAFILFPTHMNFSNLQLRRKEKWCWRWGRCYTGQMTWSLSVLQGLMAFILCEMSRELTFKGREDFLPLFRAIPIDRFWDRHPNACWVMLAHAGQATCWLCFFLMFSSRLKWNQEKLPHADKTALEESNLQTLFVPVWFSASAGGGFSFFCEIASE